MSERLTATVETREPREVPYTETSPMPVVGGAKTQSDQTPLHLRPGFGVHAGTVWKEGRTDWRASAKVGTGSRTKEYEVDGTPVTRLRSSSAEKLAKPPAVALYYPLESSPIHRLAMLLAGKLAPTRGRLTGYTTAGSGGNH